RGSCSARSRPDRWSTGYWPATATRGPRDLPGIRLAPIMRAAGWCGPAAPGSNSAPHTGRRVRSGKTSSSSTMKRDLRLDRLPTHERRLANGLTVLVREDHSAPVVAIVTHVRAGYFNEPDSLVGISHVLEHMYFKGTERFGPGEIARATKAAGGFLNAGTIYD